jgi:hypothetical protein
MNFGFSDSLHFLAKKKIVDLNLSFEENYERLSLCLVGV